MRKNSPTSLDYAPAPIVSRPIPSVIAALCAEEFSACQWGLLHADGPYLPLTLAYAPFAILVELHHSTLALPLTLFLFGPLLISLYAHLFTCNRKAFTLALTLHGACFIFSLWQRDAI